MDRYVIERDLPGAGDLTDEELHGISRTSNDVLSGMDGIMWLESYVSDDKLYCVYETDDPVKLREHAEQGGFPCDRISRVRTTITPETGR